MRWKIEEDGAEPAPAELLGKRGHEGSFARPSVDEEHARNCRTFRLIDVRLKVTPCRRNAHCRSVAKVKPGALYEDIMIGAAMP